MEEEESIDGNGDGGLPDPPTSTGSVKPLTCSTGCDSHLYPDAHAIPCRLLTCCVAAVIDTDAALATAVPPTATPTGRSSRHRRSLVTGGWVSEEDNCETLGYVTRGRGQFDDTLVAKPGEYDHSLIAKTESTCNEELAKALSLLTREFSSRRQQLTHMSANKAAAAPQWIDGDGRNHAEFLEGLPVYAVEGIIQVIQVPNPAVRAVWDARS
eukprot:1273922-Rhodomonas_salina.1